MTCNDNPGKKTCHSFETQLCHDPIPEQVCDQRTKVICKPETFTICKTVVSTVEKEECLELREPDCKEYRKKMCYNGYSSGECHIHTEDECHYITKPCTYKDGYGCKPTKEKICNQISKPKCTGAGASIQCTNLYNQHCKVKPVIKCIQVPVVTVSDHCETKTVNNCNEVSSSECLTIYKTQCEEPERHEICL